MPPEAPSNRPQLVILCGVFGAVTSFMGVMGCISVLRGGHVRHNGTDLSTFDSALVALFLLGLGVVLLWAAEKLKPPPAK